jgi:hypothetical protein
MRVSQTIVNNWFATYGRRVQEQKGEIVTGDLLDPKKRTPVGGISRDDMIPTGNSADKEAMYGTDRPIDYKSWSLAAVLAQRAPGSFGV